MGLQTVPRGGDKLGEKLNKTEGMDKKLGRDWTEHSHAESLRKGGGGGTGVVKDESWGKKIGGGGERHAGKRYFIIPG